MRSAWYMIDGSGMMRSLYRDHAFSTSYVQAPGLNRLGLEWSFVTPIIPNAEDTMINLKLSSWNSESGEYYYDIPLFLRSSPIKGEMTSELFDLFPRQPRGEDFL